MNIAAILAGKSANAHTSLTKSVDTIAPEATVAEAVHRMRDERIDALIVSQDEVNIIGMISDRSIVDALVEHGGSVLRMNVRDVMATGILTCTSQERIAAIMAAMVVRQVRHIPVVDGAGGLCGLISMGDVIKYQMDELRTEADAMRIYISGGT